MSIKHYDDGSALSKFEFELARQTAGTVIMAFCDSPECSMLHVAQMDVGYILLKDADHARELAQALTHAADNWEAMRKEASK